MGYGNTYIKQLFDKSPYAVKVMATSAYGMQQRIKRFDKNFTEELALLQQSQYWNEEKLKAYQKEKLDIFFKQVKDVPYYANNELYKDLLQNDRPVNEFPVLSKQVVKQNSKAFYNVENKKVIWGHTSGTTGSAMVFPLSKEAYQYEYAFRTMHYKWGGVEFQKRDKVAMCSGHPVALPGRSKPPFWSYDMVNNHLFFSSYHMGGDTLEYYIKKLENFDPLLIHGYPSSIYLLALAYKKYGKNKLALKSVYTSSETLLAFQRKAIEEAFGVKVYNWYGTSEMTANIVECECGELHLKAEHSFTEILNDNNDPCKPGETGRIVSTNFNNIAFPLIRYDVGDMATVAIDQAAKCGRSGLLIAHVEGRMEDYIVTPDGRIIGRLDHLFKDAVNVMEAQIIQEVKEEIVLRIVKKETYTQNDEQLILNEARVRLGNVIRITFDYVEKIPRAKSGKYQFIISKIQRSATNILQ